MCLLLPCDGLALLESLTVFFLAFFFCLDFDGEEGVSTLRGVASLTCGTAVIIIIIIIIIIICYLGHIQVSLLRRHGAGNTIVNR